MELFTIGDSVSQGFMNLAAARTDLCYSTLIARLMGLGDYYYPTWPSGGLPANLEDVLRTLDRRCSSRVDLWEVLKAGSIVNEVLDKAEDYYERQGGSQNAPCPGNVQYFNNVSVYGFTVSDSWCITPRLCREEIEKANRKSGGDNYLWQGWPNAAFYRTAHRVLCPGGGGYDDFSQLKWLEHHVTKQKDGGVRNLILWLGSNNALGTIIDLSIRQTPRDVFTQGYPAWGSAGFDQRAMEKLHFSNLGYNLWHPDQFRKDYETLLDYVDGIMSRNPDAIQDWNVFVGDVPALTILPLAKGIGPTTLVDGKVYYKYYTYFPFEEEEAHRGKIYLTLSDALFIDDTIEEFNKIIRETIEKKNRLHQNNGGPKRYHLVSIWSLLNSLAWKRNDGKPTYQMPQEVRFHYPRVNTKSYLSSPDGRLVQGGVFGLDGVHPTATGQGMIADEFLRVMAGVAPGVPFVEIELDAKDPSADQPQRVKRPEYTDGWWENVLKSDTLYNAPIGLTHQLHDPEFRWLAEQVVRLIKFLKRKGINL
jgi:hypothetical protein